jgi:nuclear transport factor 2 (NTF2) superfamily protein
MVMVKKSAGGGGAPNLDLLAAKLRIVEAELSLEEKQVQKKDGGTFTAEPNFNVKVEVMKNLVEPGKDEGVRFYDRFKLKQDEDNEWAMLRYSKLGNLLTVRYGEEWFGDEAAEFKAEDFEGWEFVAQVEPKTDPKGNPLTGSTINWKSIRATGGPDEREDEVGVANLRNAIRDAKALPKAAKALPKASAETVSEEDFDDLPF